MQFTQATFARFGIAAALVAASASASAAVPITLNTTKMDATAKLTLTADVVETLDLASVKITSAGKTTGTDGANFSMPITSLTVDLFTLNPIKGSAVGAGLDITRGSRSLNLNNFLLDFSKKQVFADVTTSAGGSFTQQAIYTFDVTQPLKISLTGGLTMTETVGNMLLTPWAVETFASALNIPTVLKDTLATLDFGSIASTVRPLNARKTTAAAVPEPSTYALLGLGLAAAALVARRRAA